MTPTPEQGRALRHLGAATRLPQATGEPKGQCYHCGSSGSETNQDNTCRPCFEENEAAKVKAANINAAANHLADVALELESLEEQLGDQAGQRHWQTLPRMVALRVALHFAERRYHLAHLAALAAGLKDGEHYAARLSSGQPCRLFMDGPCVALDILN